MSWGTRIRVENGVWEEIDASVLDTAEHKEQRVAALNAVLDLIESGAFGHPDGIFAVTITGHGNPGNVPAPGWANDYININIQQGG